MESGEIWIENLYRGSLFLKFVLRLVEPYSGVVYQLKADTVSSSVWFLPNADQLCHQGKLPVPKYFQSGNEHIGKLTWESMKKWLSRGVERQVTSAWIAFEQPGKSEWHLQEVPVQLNSSPFKDGTLVVVCCGNEALKANISGQLPPPFKLKLKSTNAESSVRFSVSECRALLSALCRQSVCTKPIKHDLSRQF